MPVDHSHRCAITGRPEHGAGTPRARSNERCGLPLPAARVRARRPLASLSFPSAALVPLSGAVPLKPLQDKARCVVNMSTEGTRAGAPQETAAWNKGDDIGCIGESLQITCPRRSFRASSATSRTPSRRLQICAEVGRSHVHGLAWTGGGHRDRFLGCPNHPAVRERDLAT